MFLQKAKIVDGKINFNNLGKVDPEDLSAAMQANLSLFQRLNLRAKSVYTGIRRFGLSKFKQDGGDYAPTWFADLWNKVNYYDAVLLSKDIKIIKGSRPDTYEVSQYGAYVVSASWTVSFIDASVKKCKFIDFWLFKNDVAYERLDCQITATLINVGTDLWDYQGIAHLNGVASVNLEKHDYIDIRLMFNRALDGQDWGAWVNHSGNLAINYYDNNIEVI